MPAADATPPGPPSIADPLRPLRRRAAVSWLAGALAAGLLWGQHQASVLHPAPLPFILLMTAAIVAGVGGLVRGLWRAARGPSRPGAVAWTFLAFVPILFWAAIGVFGFRSSGRREIPRNFPMTLARLAGASLMEIQCGFRYPHRLETTRLVMSYDDGVSRPEQDADAMDRHVARLEELTGRPLRNKIHWVRGRLLGQGNVAFYGLALGSSQSPAEQLDRHELAHAVLYQHDQPDTDPPTLLLEGWAESQSSDPFTLLTAAGAALRDGAPTGRLRELTGPGWYHRDQGPVYPVGGGLVAFILKKYGVFRFIDLYLRSRPGDFDSACREALGVDLDTLESEFREEVRR